MSIAIVKGDLLEAEDDFIGHQCNCITRNAKGLAEVLFAKYPYANDYHHDRKVGTYHIHGGNGRRWVVNLFGQYRPGDVPSERAQRVIWLRESLESFLHHVSHRKVTLGLPYLIGCGLAGGDWNVYSVMLQGLAIRYPNVKITLYQKD